MFRRCLNRESYEWFLGHFRGESRFVIGINQDMLFPSRPCALQNTLTSVLLGKLGCWVCGSPSPQPREGSRKRAGSLGWFSSTASGASGEWRAPEASEAPPPVSPTLTWRRVVTETLTLAWMETGRLGSEGVTSQSLRSSEVVRG